MKYSHQPVEIQWTIMKEGLPPDNEDVLLGDMNGNVCIGYLHNDEWYVHNETYSIDEFYKFWAYTPPCPGRIWGKFASSEACDALLREARKNKI
jgi:hypothetical protein